MTGETIDRHFRRGPDLQRSEINIRDCLESLIWADEILVVDAFSTDETVAIAREFTDRVILNAWEGRLRKAS